MREVKVVPAAALAEATAAVFREAVREALARQGVARVALSGGHTPLPAYRLLAADAGLDWSRIHLFWGDERGVPPEHPDSNYGAAKKALLEEIDIPAANVHRILAERPASEAAALYEAEIRSAFGISAGSVPHFDLIFLGLGPDGHTASLFPGTAALEEHERLVVANEVPGKGTRITFTFPVLDAAQRVVFLVGGAEKAAIVQEILHGPPDRYPAQQVHPTPGHLLLLLDTAAAGGVRT